MLTLRALAPSLTAVFILDMRSTNADVSSYTCQTRRHVVSGEYILERFRPTLPILADTTLEACRDFLE